MNAARVRIGGKTFSYRVDKRSWHPTFDAVFLGRPPSTDVADALAPYANVYLVDLDALPGVEHDALLAWTTATGVRKPLLIATERTSDAASSFARRFPQFTLGIVVLPGEERERRRTPFAPVERALATAMALLLRRNDRSPPRDQELPAPTAPLLVLGLDWSEDVRSTAESVRRFATSIKPDSRASERLPERMRRAQT